jgi:hypothetical protein
MCTDFSDVTPLAAITTSWCEVSWELASVSRFLIIWNSAGAVKKAMVRAVSSCYENRAGIFIHRGARHGPGRLTGNRRSTLHVVMALHRLDRRISGPPIAARAGMGGPDKRGHNERVGPGRDSGHGKTTLWRLRAQAPVLNRRFPINSVGRCCSRPCIAVFSSRTGAMSPGSRSDHRGGI